MVHYALLKHSIQRVFCAAVRLGLPFAAAQIHSAPSPFITLIVTMRTKNPTTQVRFEYADFTSKSS